MIMAYDPNYYRTEEYVQHNYPPAGYTPHVRFLIMHITSLRLG